MANLKAVYRFNAIPIKIPTQFFKNQKGQFANSSGITKKKPRLAKTLLNDKRISGGITMTDLKLYYPAIVINTAWYWYSDRQVDQWTRVGDLEMNPHTNSHLIFDKATKIIQQKKKTKFSTKGAGSTGG